MKQKLSVIILSFFFLGGLSIAVAYNWLYGANIHIEDDGIFYITADDTFENVLEKLESKGYLSKTYAFRLVARLKKYPQLIKPGRYRLDNNMSNVEAINMLRRGDQKPIVFTFNNVRTIEEFAGKAQAQLGTDSATIVHLFNDSCYLKQFDVTPATASVLLIPNSYQILWNPPAEQLIFRMYNEYKAFWNEKRCAQAAALKLSPIDVVTLASIVEEETIQPQEYAVIAGVYINRLRKNIPLAACPTIKFALQDFTLKRILNRHLTIDSPYNTYKNTGLPLGPIRIASIQIVDSVLNSKKHDYLFFCAKSDFSGTHHFSKTLSQHNQYAKEYHDTLNAQKINN